MRILTGIRRQDLESDLSVRAVVGIAGCKRLDNCTGEGVLGQSYAGEVAAAVSNRTRPCRGRLINTQHLGNK